MGIGCVMVVIVIMVVVVVIVAMRMVMMMVVVVTRILKTAHAGAEGIAQRTICDI